MKIEKRIKGECSEGNHIVYANCKCKMREKFEYLRRRLQGHAHGKMVSMDYVNSRIDDCISFFELETKGRDS